MPVALSLNYTKQFSICGCNFSGHLVTCDLEELSQEIRSRKPLDGFNSGASLDAKDEALAAIEARHSNVTVKLGIPVLVVEVPAQEWQETVDNFSNP